MGIEDFEDMGVILNWTNLQMLVYGKKLLKGAAREYINCESNISSWDKLKSMLIDEFFNISSPAEVHQQLMQRKKKATETHREYVYAIQKLANQINLDEKSILFYLLNGIPDDTNKIILLG